MTQTHPKVDAFFSKAIQWRSELEQLRAIALDCGLTEELKWGKPCYTSQQSNIVILQGFKEFCALLFAKGALLKDPEGILEKPGENTQAARRIPFTATRDIIELEPVLKSYIQESIAAEKAGLEVTFKKTPEPVPEELENKFKDSPAFKTAFHALTPGRQRAYILHFSAAKQPKTREARIEKCLPQIMAGKGLNDDYKWSQNPDS
jgi:uncharacterized protein YdeI (YjbR/CyaY-like superfamily)